MCHRRAVAQGDLKQIDDREMQATKGMDYLRFAIVIIS